jgi:3-deoxy-D-manno-octulosonic-acid transferase
MRVLYSLLLYLLLPGVLLRLWIKGRRDPAYRRHWRERFGLDAPQSREVIWVHAVSVGEVRAAEPLVRALQARHRGQALLLTVTTPTGRRTVRQLFGDQVSCRYLPYDLPGAVRRFLAALQPAMLVVMEVELWPNLYARLAARGVPLYLVNARLSEKSWRAYRRLGGLMGETLRSVRHIAAQSATDRTRFVQLGAHPDRVSVTGNLKFDIRLPDDFHARSQQLRARLADRQPVWIAASTHEGEEAAVLEAHAELLRQYPQAVLILAPRHPERAVAVGRQCRGKGFTCRFSSKQESDGASVIIVDELGLLVYCYPLADIAFVGGSLVEKGGHNPIEAVVAGAPVVSGPNVDNFADIYAQLLQAGAAFIIRSATELSARAQQWVGDAQARGRAVSAGQEVTGKNRGAVDRVLAVIDSER